MSFMANARFQRPMKIFLFLAIFPLASCNPVGFTGSQDKTAITPESVVTTTIPGTSVPTTTVPSSSGTISCQVRLNGNQTSVTLPAAGPNPTVAANCSPSAVTYSWVVTRNGASATIPGLAGASSTPDFVSVGAGTYSIVLTASAQNYTSYTSPAVTVIISPAPTPTPDISCSPRLNGNQTSLTLNSGSPNPTVEANCQPADSSCAWGVTLGSQVVTIPGLSGCSATADFSAASPGTYNLSLTATRSGYNSFVSPQPLKVTIPQKTTRSAVTTKTVTTQDNQLDVTLIIDDSNSMLADNQKLAQRLQNFVADLGAAGFDWQMCVTVTRAQQLTSSNPTLYWGASRNWVGASTGYILKSSSGNVAQIFKDTINQIGAGWAGTDDERAIKAAWWHLWNGDVRYNDVSGCYRKDAGLATIILSDEDERSVGGDISQQYYAGEYKALENDDLPKTYTNYVKEVFGSSKRFAVNSIIVRPGDSSCLSKQDAQGYKAHYGNKYNELAQLTGGTSGSICDADYSTNLTYFKNQIVKQMASLPLDCNPSGNVNVTYSNGFSAMTRVENGVLFFTPAVPVGVTIRAEYQCPL